MNRMSRLWAAVLLTLFAMSAQALTYQPMMDEDLLDQTPTVLRGLILDSGVQSGSSHTAYPVLVQQVYKGSVPVSEILLSVPGTRAGIGRRIPGMPSFSAGDEVVLFVSENMPGQYQLMQATLGAFRAETDALGRKVFVRQLAETHALPLSVPNRGAVAEGQRLATEFLAWLGDPAPEQSAATTSPAETGGTTEKDEYTLLHTGGNPPARWWVFDGGGSVTLRAGEGGQDDLPGGGFSEFQAGIGAWNGDPSSKISYVYGGTTTATGGLEGADGVNAILFNDPNGEALGTFDCENGGVLAIGGFTTSGVIRSYDGQNFGEIIEGDIVINNGTGCFLRLNNNTNAAEVFTHELGHTLGLGHSCDDSEGDILSPFLDDDSCSTATPAERQAVMKATPHADGRGATLGNDDRAGVAYLYPEEDVPFEPEPTGEVAGNNTGGNDDDGGGGGCAMGGTRAFDPLWLSLLTLALWRAGLSQRRRRMAGRVE